MSVKTESEIQKTKVKVDKSSKDPDRLEAQIQVKAEEITRMTQFLTNLNTSIDTNVSNRSVHTSRARRFYNRRQGIRPVKILPWKDCSNDSLMTEEKVISKLKPSFFNLMWANKRVANFEVDPEAEEGEITDEEADINSHIFNHIVRNKIVKPKRTSSLMFDRMLQDGKTFVKVTYSYIVEKKSFRLNLEDLTDEETVSINNIPDDPAGVTAFLLALLEARGIKINLALFSNEKEFAKGLDQYFNGDSLLTFNYHKLAKDCPKWSIVKLRDLVVNEGCNDLQDATMICHKMKWKANTLRKMIQQGRVNKDVGQMILTNSGSSIESTNTGSTNTGVDNQIELSIQRATGSISTESEDDIDVYEVCCYADPDNSGITRKSIVTFCPKYLTEPLKFISLPYEDGYWPYAEFVAEETDEGFLSSRPIGHKINFFAAGIDRKHNQRNDAIDLVSKPMLKYVDDKVIGGKIHFTPGQGIPCKDSVNDVDVITVNPGATSELLREQQVLQYQVEDIAAVPDFTMTDPNSSGAKARTATEVVEKSADRKQIFSLQLELTTERLAFLYFLTWSRQLQFGPDKIEINIPDEAQAPLENGQQPKKRILWDKTIGSKKMTIIPSGSFANTNVQEMRMIGRAVMELSEKPLFGPMIKSFNVLEDVMMSYDVTKRKRWMYSRVGWQKQMAEIAENNAKKAQQAKVAEIQFEKAKLEQQGINEVNKIRAKGEVDLALQMAKMKLEKEGEKKDDKGKEKNEKAKS